MGIKYNNNKKKNEGKTDLEKKQVDEALHQAKSYLKLIEKSETKIFIGCNITSEKKLFISKEIIKGNKSEKFDNLSISL